MMAEVAGLRKYATDSLCFSLFTTALCTTLLSLPLVHACKIDSRFTLQYSKVYVSCFGMKKRGLLRGCRQC